jgi:hypothetical protein
VSNPLFGRSRSASASSRPSALSTADLQPADEAALQHRLADLERRLARARGDNQLYGAVLDASG